MKNTVWSYQIGEKEYIFSFDTDDKLLALREAHRRYGEEGNLFKVDIEIKTKTMPVFEPDDRPDDDFHGVIARR